MNAQYLCFTPSTPVELAVKRFIERFSFQPKRCYVGDRLLWVGPIDEEDEDGEEFDGAGVA